MKLTINEENEMNRILDTCPYWVLEQAIKDRAGNLPQICEDCETLKDAIETGVNMVILVMPNGEKVDVGSLKPNGEICLETQSFTLESIADYPVVFDELDTDEDSFTIAYFKPLEK